MALKDNNFEKDLESYYNPYLIVPVDKNLSPLNCVEGKHIVNLFIILFNFI